MSWFKSTFFLNPGVLNGSTAMTIELSCTGQAVAMWPGYQDAGISSLSMCVCFALGKAERDGYRRLGVAILNSESICLAMAFQAIKEMDLKINSWVWALGLERGPLTLAFLKDDVSLIPQWDRLGRVLPSQWTSTRDPGRERWRLGSSISNQIYNF